MLKKLNAFTDRFVPSGASLSVDQITQIRVLNNSSIIAALFAWNYILICWFISYPVAVITLFVSGILFFIIPFLIKRGVSYSVMANFFILVTFVSINIYIYTQGGFSRAVITPWLLFTICMAMLLGGFRMALAWTLLCSTSATIFLWFDFKEQYPAILYNIEWETPYRWIAFSGLIFLTLIVINIFKNSENFAKQQLLEKNNELEQTLDQLKQTQSQLIQKEKLASLGQVTSGIAHEISNPMNFILNFSHLLKELFEDYNNPSSTEAEKKEMMKTMLASVEKIHANGKRADEIIKRMLEYSSNRQEEKTRFNVSEMVNDLFSIILKTMNNSHPDFTCTLKVEGTADVEAFANTHDFSRAVINLLTNAFESMISNHTVSPEIKMSLETKGKQVQMIISDNGPGLKPGTADQIFIPFFTTKVSEKRVGLGLSLAHDLILANNGNLELNKAASSGASFIVTLPA